MGQPRYLTLTALARKAVVGRTVLNNLVVKGRLSVDAWLILGDEPQPLFEETRALAIMLAVSSEQSKSGDRLRGHRGEKIESGALSAGINHASASGDAMGKALATNP